MRPAPSWWSLPPGHERRRNITTKNLRSWRKLQRVSPACGLLRDDHSRRECDQLPSSPALTWGGKTGVSAFGRKHCQWGGRIVAAGGDRISTVRFDRASGAAKGSRAGGEPASRRLAQRGAGGDHAGCRRDGERGAEQRALRRHLLDLRRPRLFVLPVSNTSAAVGNAASYAVFGLGSRYLQMLGGLGGPGQQSSLFGTGPNPGGGGAPAPAAPPRFRAWAETYGLTAHTGAQTDFPGDSRRTYGGVAGLAMNVTPGAMLGLSVDQSRSRIDITGLPQHATLDLTQVGINGAYELGASGPFRPPASPVSRGVDSSRDTPSGGATASYRRRPVGRDRRGQLLHPARLGPHRAEIRRRLDPDPHRGLFRDRRHRCRDGAGRRPPNAAASSRAPRSATPGSPARPCSTSRATPRRSTSCRSACPP